VDPDVKSLMFTSIKLKKEFIVCLLFFLLTSTAGATAYIVKPAPSDQVGASINGVKPIEPEWFTYYWQYLIFVAIKNLFSSLNGFPYLRKIIFIITGFKIVDNVNLLDNSKRNSIYTYIETRPGACLTEIMENTGLNRGSVRYHLRILKTQNKTEAYEDGGKIRYFQNNSMYIEREKQVLMALQNITSQKIISGILNGKCNTNLTLAQEIGISKSAVSEHVKKLKEIDLIKETKKGRNIIYRINALYQPLIKRYK
jgi:predicted transcriptional regulator